MARKKRSVVEVKERAPMFDDLSPQARQAIAAGTVGGIGLFFFFFLLGVAGRGGVYTEIGLSKLFGTGAWIAPIATAFYVFVLMNPKDDDHVSTSKMLGISLFFIALLAALELYTEGLGGWTGLSLSYPLEFLFGEMVISIFLIFNTGLRLPRFGKTAGDIEEYDEELDIEALEAEIAATEAENADEEEVADEEEEAPKKGLQTVAEKVGEKLGMNKSDDLVVKNFSGPYLPPPLTLLKKDTGKAVAGDVKANSLTIKRTLKEFGINVEMDAVESGPAITRYSLKPAQGVRISRIVALQQELQLALKASTIRIEAPIPGKSLVGIEVPNAVRSTVGLASILKNPEYTDSPRPLLVALGKD